MYTFLQPVDLPDRCFLLEILYWVAFQRLPVPIFTDGVDLRDTVDFGPYEVDFFDHALSEDETARAGIPTDPKWFHWVESEGLPASYFKALNRKSATVQLHPKAWLPHYERAILEPSTKITKALMEGTLRAKGRLLPRANVDDARPIVEANGGTIFDIDRTDIPPAFWSVKGIDFDASAAGNGTEYYCHISCLTDDVISLFPPVGKEVSGYDHVPKSIFVSSRSGRGRPPFSWEPFHLEVARLLLRHELPKKKESAIQHFQTWLFEKHHFRPARSTISEKLTPYYDQFMKDDGQKIQ